MKELSKDILNIQETYSSDIDEYSFTVCQGKSSANVILKLGMLHDEEPTKEDIIKTLLEHAQMLMASKGEHIAMIEMRTHAGWYLKQIPGTKQYRPLIVSIKTMDELTNICKEILQNPYFK